MVFPFIASRPSQQANARPAVPFHQNVRSVILRDIVVWQNITTHLCQRTTQHCPMNTPQNDTFPLAQSRYGSPRPALCTVHKVYCVRWPSPKPPNPLAVSYSTGFLFFSVSAAVCKLMDYRQKDRLKGRRVRLCECVRVCLHRSVCKWLWYLQVCVCFVHTRSGRQRGALE